jgi:hypothetical protein
MVAGDAHLRNTRTAGPRRRNAGEVTEDAVLVDIVE